MIIERVALPGIGVCHTATSARRQRLGVVCHRTGRRDLIFYDPHDPERASQAVVLDAAEARQVAELLAAAVPVDHVADPARGRAVSPDPPRRRYRRRGPQPVTGPPR